MKIVRLVKRDGTWLFVEGLDAIDKSPVLDIKPYVANMYPHEDVHIPEWIVEIQKIYQSVNGKGAEVLLFGGGEAWSLVPARAPMPISRMVWPGSIDGNASRNTSAGPCQLVIGAFPSYCTAGFYGYYLDSAFRLLPVPRARSPEPCRVFPIQGIESYLKSDYGNQWVDPRVGEPPDQKKIEKYLIVQKPRILICEC